MHNAEKSGIIRHGYNGDAQETAPNLLPVFVLIDIFAVPDLLRQVRSHKYLRLNMFTKTRTPFADAGWVKKSTGLQHIKS